MKKTILLLVIFCCSSMIYAQHQWRQELIKFGEDASFPYEDISRTDDGLVLITEKEIVEINERGELKYDYDGLTSIGFLSQSTFIERVSDGYIAITRNGGSSFKIIIEKIDLDNHVVYTTTLNNNNVGANTQKKYPAGFLDFTNQQLFLATVDSVFMIDATTGNVLSRKGGSGFYSDVTQNGNVFITTTVGGNISEYTSTGDLNWTTSTSATLNCIENTDNNSYIAGGVDASGNTFVVFMDDGGTQINTKSYGDGVINDIIKTADSGFALAGETNGQSFLIKTDAAGNMIWQKNYGTGNGLKVELADDGGFYFYQRAPNQLIKTDADGNTSTTIDRRYIKGFEAINVSNISTVIGATGMMFQDGLDNHFESPKGGGVNSVYSSGLWIGALDAGSNLHMAAQTYGANYLRDYRAGFSTCIEEEFLKVWKINRSDLIDFKNDIADGVADRPIPHHILTYPAKGNSNFRGRYDKFYNITDDAAPFVDVNSDGFYNALDGDYPVMKGDEMLVWLMNDDDIHAQTQGAPLKINIIGTAYGYECPDNSTVNNNLFVKFDIINNYPENFQDLYLGMFNDFDLGCYLDDYVGVDTPSNTVYVYNEKIDDGASCVNPPNVPAYGTNIPVQSMTLLDKSMTSHMYYNNGSGFITYSESYYNMLKGKWGDGTPLTASGNGYQTTGAVTTYAFPSNPSDVNGWSMCSSNLTASDSRSVIGSGPYNLPSGSVMSIEMAYTIHPNISHPCPDISANVIPTITSLQNYYDNDELDWEINLGEDRTIDAGTTLTLDPMYGSGSNYNWSTGATTSTIDVTTPGLYTVTVTHPNGCKKTDEVNITGFSSSDEVIEHIKTQIFPNPTSNNLTINYELTTETETDGLVFDIINPLGQVVKSKAVNQQSGQLIFDVHDLASGIYILNIKTDREILKTQKIVKH